MKKLKKILLINWLYFSKQLIEVDDINFLTGKNAAGKSTIVDALQIVLLGETNSRNFNKAASDTSQRTLDGYLRADMDVSSPKCRRGKDFSSYIACEFWDDQSGTVFTAGIVFDCRGDGSRRDQFYLYDGPIPETCFTVSRKPMDIAALRAWFKERPEYHYEMYDTNNEYRRNLLAKWNVHNEQVCRMMKKAVSFRPIVNIQDFITENICDIPDKPDIEEMQQNIRDYKRHEELAKRQEEKLAKLSEISKAFREYQAAVDRYRSHRFLSLWAEKESLEQRIKKYGVDIETCKEAIQQREKRCEDLKQEIGRKEARRIELIADKAQSDVYQEQNRLRGQKEHLEQEKIRLLQGIGRTTAAIRAEAAVLTSYCDHIAKWTDIDKTAELRNAAEKLLETCLPMKAYTQEVFADSTGPFRNAKENTTSFTNVLHKATFELQEEDRKLRKEIDGCHGTLKSLRDNRKDYPPGLLDLKTQLQARFLSQYKRKVTIEILADVLEIAEGQEAWRGAVEGYLHTQKFYMLVDPESYQKVLSIYDKIKNSYGKHSFGLVDVGKLRERERIDPWEDSLAKKIETDDSLARSYIDYLLGRVVCCADTNQIRKYRIAITADGMVYQGYVARPLPRASMEDAFIGRKAIDLRIEMVTARLEELSGREQVLRPVCDELESQQKHEFLFTERFVKEVEERQGEYVRGMEIDRELTEIEAQLSELNLFWLDEMDRQIRALERDIEKMRGEINNCSSEIGGLKATLTTLENEKIPEQKDGLSKCQDELNIEFSQDYIDRMGLPRYGQELARLRTPASIAKNFGDQVGRTQNEMEGRQRQLFQARREYVQQFQPCSFQVEATDNREYEEERKRLEESELPLYREKIRLARESALEQFQNDFLAKLRGGIEQVQEQVKNLNRALKQAQFGTDQYQFQVDPSPDYYQYYEMIMDKDLIEGEGGLFAIPFQQKYGQLIEDLFGRITASDDAQQNMRRQSELQKNIELYSDFRTYLKFDMITTDQNGNRQLLSQTLNTKSGGETQTPFYIAVLASFAQLYRVNDTSSFGNTVRLIIFDEAFNKMDSDRIIESVRLLRKMHLQAIICTPPDKLPDIMPEADRTLLVCKEKYTMRILPYTKEVVESWSEM